MLRTFSWLLVPGMLLAFAPGAMADVVTTKGGERVFGTVLTETPVGVSILEPNGLMRGFHVDEVGMVRRDPATRTAAGIALLLERERKEAAELARLEALEEARRPFLGHEVKTGVWGTSLGIFAPAGYLHYKLLLGQHAAFYLGSGYGYALATNNGDPILDEETGEQAVDSKGKLLYKQVRTTFLDVPFGLEARFMGAYVGGGASYVLPSGLANGAKLKSQVMPHVAFGYAFHPAKRGLGFGFDARYGIPLSGSTPLYGGSLSASYEF